MTQSAGLRIGDNADLQQAFVSYIAPVGSGLRFDAGKFVTHMGYELIEGYDGYNDNYSRSLLFNYAIPLTHTGIKASYSPTARVSLMAMVVNGWDHALDNNASKSIGAQLVLKPTRSGRALRELHRRSRECRRQQQHPARRRPDRHRDGQPDALARRERRLRHRGRYERRHGGQGRQVERLRRATRRSAPRARSRSVCAPRRSRTTAARGSASARRGSNEFTITPTFKFGSNFVVRPELRYDTSDSEPFFDDKGIAKKNQATIGINALWVY